MRETMRLIATVIIWGAMVPVIGIILGTTSGPASRMNGGEIIGLIAIFMAGAIAMTYAVWHSGFNIGRAEDYGASSRERLGKSKRAGRDRVEHLIDDLEDDEIYRLEELLLDRDKEARQRDR
jgi:hypothetical protein